MNEQPHSHLYLITGSDSGMIEAAARKLVHQMVGEQPDPFLCDTIVESDSVNTLQALQQTVASVQSPPFIGGCKTVWLKNFSGFGQEKQSGALGESFSRLYAFIEGGVPEDICLVLSGPDVDRRRKLYKLCRQFGTLMEYDKPAAGAKGEQQMRQIIAELARDRGVRVEHDAVQALIQVLGSDTGRLASELDKLTAFCDNGRQPITAEAVGQLCQGEPEVAGWAIRDAMGRRDLGEVMRLTRSILRSERDPDRAVLAMIRQTADQFYSMIQTLLLKMETKARGAAAISRQIEAMDGEQKNRFDERGLEIVNFHPYRARMIAEQADNYTGPELVEAVKKLRDGYWQCISSPLPSQIVWENLAMTIVGDGKAARQ